MSEYKRKVIFNMRYTDTPEQRLGKILANNAQAIADEINLTLAKKQYQSAKKIVDYAFDAFYGSYDQHMYKRTGNMKNVVDYGIKNREQFSMVFDSSLMGGHRDNESVYYFDFMNGLHGGPRWRTPTPQFIANNGPSNVRTADGYRFATHPWQFWHPAKVPVGPAPYKIIITSWNNYIDNVYPNEKTSVIKQVLSKYMNKAR